MKLKCLKFCFLNSVPFCARTQMKVDLSCKGFLRSRQEQLFQPHCGTVFCFLGSRFSGFSRVLVPGFQVFCRVPLGSQQVPGPEFFVFLGSSQGATRVPGSGFLVCPYKQRTKFTVLKNFPSNVWFIRNISIQLRESIPTTIKNMLTASGIKLCYLAFDNIGSFISFSSLILH